MKKVFKHRMDLKNNTIRFRVDRNLFPLRLFAVLVLFFSMTSLDVHAQKASKPYHPIQVEGQPWVKNKPNQPWKYYSTRVIDSLITYKQANDKENKYGSLLSKKTTASGFFRVEKLNGRWWVIDPEGYYNIQRVVNGFRRGTSDFNLKQFNEKFGTNEKWVQTSASEFNNIRFDGTGSWSTDSIVQKFNKQSAKQKLSFSVNLGLMGNYGKKRGGTYQLPGNIGFPNQTIFVFDPEFRMYCDSVMPKLVANFKSDTNLFGYFSDNELPFGLKNLEGYLSLKNPSDPGRLAAEKWLTSKGISANKITDTERAEFAGFVAEKYFRIVSAAIKKADKNHLYIGSRVHGAAKFVESIMKAADKYCDVVSINYYGVWTPGESHLSNWAKWMNKPFIVTEFYTKGMDSGLANTGGAGFTVRTQTDRGLAYQNFCLALLEDKNCVGWHWFKYQDNDPTAKGVDQSNVDSNKGIVDNNYQLYKPLTDKMKQLNEQVYSLIEYFDK